MKVIPALLALLLAAGGPWMTAPAKADPAPLTTVTIGAVPNGPLDIQVAKEAAVVTAPRSEIVVNYAVSNAGTKPLEFTLGKLRGRDGEVKTEWTRADTAAALVDPIRLEPGARLVITLSAKVQAAGRYTATLTSTATGAPVTYLLVVNRGAVLPGPDMLVAPSAQAQVRTSLWPWKRATTTVFFNVTNSGEAAVVLDAPFLGEVSRARKNVSQQANLGGAPGRITCASEPVSAPQTPIPPGKMTISQNSTCKGSIPATVDGPGVYHLQVLVNGDEGGQARVDLVLNARAPLLWAMVVALSGAVVGSCLTFWRTSGRAKLAARTALAAEADQLLVLERRCRRANLDCPIRGLRAQLATLREEVDFDRLADVETTLGAMRLRRRRILRWLDMAGSVGKLPEAQRASVKALADALGLLLDNPRSTDPVLDDAEDKLCTAYSDARPPAVGLEAVRMKVGIPSIGAAGPSGPRKNTSKSSRRTSREQFADLQSSLRAGDMLEHAISAMIVCTGAIVASWAIDPAWGGLDSALALFVTAAGIQTGGVALLRPPGTD